MIPRGGLAVQRSKGFCLLTYPHEDENKELRKLLQAIDESDSGDRCNRLSALTSNKI